MSSLSHDDIPTTNHIPVLKNDPMFPIDDGHLAVFTCPKEVRVGEKFDVKLSTDVREATNSLQVERLGEYLTVTDGLLDLPLEGPVKVECNKGIFKYRDLMFGAEAAGHTWLLEFYLIQLPIDCEDRPVKMLGGPVQIGQVSQRIRVLA
ncbi:hypothetical protein LIA77_10460 [Sarocladium implicatum]|jgi:hypothetical protein|nr:hypothetical protein LIA77_10460 [Sarocladium implicatum]